MWEGLDHTHSTEERELVEAVIRDAIIDEGWIVMVTVNGPVREVPTSRAVNDPDRPGFSPSIDSAVPRSSATMRPSWRVLPVSMCRMAIVSVAPLSAEYAADPMPDEVEMLLAYSASWGWILLDVGPP